MATVRRQVRWPYAPLVAALGSPTRDEDAAAALGVTTRTIVRWRAIGIGDNEADRAAIGAGLMPELIWGADWFADPVTRLFAWLRWESGA